MFMFDFKGESLETTADRITAGNLVENVLVRMILIEFLRWDIFLPPKHGIEVTQQGG
jgi:hypothetical protein